MAYRDIALAAPRYGVEASFLGSVRPLPVIAVRAVSDRIADGNEAFAAPDHVAETVHVLAEARFPPNLTVPAVQDRVRPVRQRHEPPAAPRHAVECGERLAGAGRGGRLPAESVAAAEDCAALADCHQAGAAPGDAVEAPAGMLRRPLPAVAVTAEQDRISADRDEALAAPDHIAQPIGGAAGIAGRRRPDVPVTAVQDGALADCHEAFAVPGDAVELRRGAGVACHRPAVAIVAVHDRAIAPDCDETSAAPSDAAQIGARSGVPYPLPTVAVAAVCDGAVDADRHEAAVAPGNAFQASHVARS